MPSPPPSRHNSVQTGLHTAGRHRFSDDDDDDDYDDADSDASYHPPSKSRNNGKEQRTVMAQLRRLSQEEASYHTNYFAPPPPHPPWWSCYSSGPPSPAAASTSSVESIESYHRRQRSFASSSGINGIVFRSTPAVHFHPYPPQQQQQQQQQQQLQHHRSIERDDFMSGRMILPRLANYLVKNPGEPPENYLLHHESTSPPPSPKRMGTRRLSVQDLCNPIESLEPNVPQQVQDEQGIDLTEDEFQALQGLGRFRLVAMADAKP
ncbi:hypothetical protein BX666DRAFT_1875054 [Dichotomocladium elegans]|nr:hypothetical protein BX666DRAFT_1875054 [Dichotomocladium elegans]